jgi:hypothetical protein
MIFSSERSDGGAPLAEFPNAKPAAIAAAKITRKYFILSWPILAAYPMEVATAGPVGWAGCPDATARDSAATASYPAVTAWYPGVTGGRRRDSAAAVGSAGPAGSRAASASVAMGGVSAAWAGAVGDARAGDAAAPGDAPSNRVAHTRDGRHSNGPNNRRC